MKYRINTIISLCFLMSFSTSMIAFFGFGGKPAREPVEYKEPVESGGGGKSGKSGEVEISEAEKASRTAAEGRTGKSFAEMSKQFAEKAKMEAEQQQSSRLSSPIFDFQSKSQQGLDMMETSSEGSSRSSMLEKTEKFTEDAAEFQKQLKSMGNKTWSVLGKESSKVIEKRDQVAESARKTIEELDRRINKKSAIETKFEKQQREQLAELRDSYQQALDVIKNKSSTVEQLKDAIDSLQSVHEGIQEGGFYSERYQDMSTLSKIIEVLQEMLQSAVEYLTSAEAKEGALEISPEKESTDNFRVETEETFLDSLSEQDTAILDADLNSLGFRDLVERTLLEQKKKAAQGKSSKSQQPTVTSSMFSFS